MITQPAKVLQTFDGYCLVETIPKSSCPRCAEGKGCGGGILAQAFANKTYQLEVAYTAGLNGDPAMPIAGSTVLVAMSSNGLLMASMVMYLLPLLMMIVSAIVISIWISSADLYTVTAAVIGLFVGALCASKISKWLIMSGITEAYLIEFSKDNCWYPAS